MRRLQVALVVALSCSIALLTNGCGDGGGKSNPGAGGGGQTTNTPVQGGSLLPPSQPSTRPDRGIK
jgi:hypothetical protein